MESDINVDYLEIIYRDCLRRLSMGWRCRSPEQLDREEKAIATRWEGDLRRFIGLIEYELKRRGH